MDVGVTELRGQLSALLERVRNGDEIVVTERGLPVARLVPVASVDHLRRLLDEGVIGRPVSAQRPRVEEWRRPRSRGSVAELVTDARR